MNAISRWADEPGYNTAIADPHIRRRHRDAIRAAGLREMRAEGTEPSHHQMCSLILDATALMLAEDATRGPAMAAAFTKALAHVCDVEGWRTKRALLGRISKRLTPSKEASQAYMHALKLERDESAVAAAREAARKERADRLRRQSLRRHGLDIRVLAADPFDDAYFGDDSGVQE